MNAVTKQMSVLGYGAHAMSGRRRLSSSVHTMNAVARGQLLGIYVKLHVA